jgi:pimeloyl-ACP methyl ester carboxylesterase
MNKTTLVLLPGLDGTEVFFGPLLAELPLWIKPIIVTYPTSGPNGYEDLLPIINRTVGPLGSFFILGWSFAGPLALMIAATRPAQTSGVILCSSFFRAPRPDLVRWRFAISAPTIGILRGFRRLRYLVRGYPSDALRCAKAETWRRVKSRVLAVRARAALAVDSKAYLTSCSAPILYLESSRDNVIPRHNVEDMRSLVPNINLVTIDGPHLALFTNPVKAAAEIAEFIQRGEAQLTTNCSDILTNPSVT